MFDRRLIAHINWLVVGLILILFAAGVLNLYSASSLRLESGVSVTPFYKKQLLWGGVALGGMFLCLIFDYRYLFAASWYLYALCVVLLVWVFWSGKVIGGSQRWLDLVFFNLQPAEVAKVSVIVLAARMLSKVEGLVGWRDLIKITVALTVPVALIVKQPDLGTGLSLLLIVGGMVLYSGLRSGVLRAIMLALPLILPLVWFQLHEYQKKRILTFLNPENDPLGAGYHIIQSKIAIGSGGFWGKGFLEGSQSQLRFLPEKHTDFAFAVFSEEWGFVGAMLLLILFCSLLYQIFRVSLESKDDFGRYLCIGVFFYFFWQIVVNIGMVLGLMPVVGMPLPFISYGGSASVVNFCLVGLVLNVSMRRFMFKRK
ncbi:MAG: rod shape-determining protein RodA [Desulfonatronovibrionaceae bacterium]